MKYIDGLAQNCSNSSALAMELMQSYANPSMLFWNLNYFSLPLCPLWGLNHAVIGSKFLTKCLIIQDAFKVKHLHGSQNTRNYITSSVQMWTDNFTFKLCCIYCHTHNNTAMYTINSSINMDWTKLLVLVSFSDFIAIIAFYRSSAAAKRKRN